MRTSVWSLAAAVALAGSLAGCGSSGSADAGATAGAASGAPSSPQASRASALTVRDAYVKATAASPMPGSATASAMPGMADGAATGMFFVLANAGGAEVSLVGGSSPDAAAVQVHEVVGGVMRQRDGGLAVPAGGEVVLRPGGDHVMLMGLTRALAPGDEVTVTLSFSDGTSLDVRAPVKAAAGGDESYSAAASASATG